ncbi:MAG: hypothetical protein COS82_01705 [Zetaproteobacteria bacterium CG06_land_8_20_14_3_00_59_53]|nr:MAG: hypothetical protein COX56_03390 [Zetaproteobacteria bacterium CG23_combo_of_CG06-09_8_20_14_all_59_86]PIQ65274.1 MAG: hypothetical protein COV97_04850 [Zetaproteobacteria bacterium CG11_big_fil_rev_8_21_14_0_20_59_439]PIU71258.1 MAG: hypothetical protein COS82_01705 [Zetaproteobacteria bacterium CG06_land_8_20_14_3_00_59_53]PIU97195.1 MAG: hypothetical protein COS62_04700 [Zetaproteobacteria bacterium CG03_land_8_20_14_0_80_59_51]PIY45959.1 MAG: hypothetical protein COZ02_07095 [Zetapr
MEQAYIWDVAASAKPGERVQVFEDQPETIATATDKYDVIDGVLFRHFIWFQDPPGWNTPKMLGDGGFAVRFRWNKGGAR